jgi:hypothetical protein
MVSRPVTAFEDFFDATIQFAVQTKTARDATAFADFLIKSIPLFRVRHSSDTLFFEPTSFDPFSIPAGLRTSGAAAIWAGSLRFHMPERLGVLAIRDNLIAMSGHHRCFDGQSFIICLNDFLRGRPRSCPKLPASLIDALSSQLSAVNDISSFQSNCFQMSSIRWTTPPPTNWSADSEVDCLTAVLPSESLQCYSKKTKMFVGLSDALWRSAMLTAHAISPKQTNFGVGNWINLRPYFSLLLLIKWGKV